MALRGRGLAAVLFFIAVGLQLQLCGGFARPNAHQTRSDAYNCTEVSYQCMICFKQRLDANKAWYASVRQDSIGTAHQLLLFKGSLVGPAAMPASITATTAIRAFHFL
jgi:hypothetical protein